jgi:hypothetical protein
MTVSHAANGGMHPLADRGNDLYETPPNATVALTRAELSRCASGSRRPGAVPSSTCCASAAITSSPAT